jgi:uncharacterized iron-regulated membrane protein
MESTAAPGQVQDRAIAQDEAIRPRSALYRAVWRWHFYAGIFAIPVIVVLSLSGLVYLFRPQIENIFPDEPVIGMGVPSAANRATEFYVDNGGTGGFAPAGRTVYVDPYTGEIEGNRNNAYNPAQIALQIHGFLMTTNWLGDEKWGDHFMELIAGWTVVLVVTGVYLWWPRGRAGKSLTGTLIPRFNLRGTRIPWRDIHAITGVLFAFVFLFFLITGLMWTDVWGAKYSEVATSWGSTYAEAPSESALPQTIGEAVPGSGGASWAQSELPVLPSGEPAGTNHSQHTEGGTLTWNPADGAPLDAVVARAQAEGFTTGYYVFMPDGETGSFLVQQYADADPEINQSAVDGRSLFVDQYSAETVGQYDFSQYGWMAKASDWGISLHEGREWGIWSQILAAAGTLAILTSAATSVVMWYKRRPSGLGAPRRIYTPSATAGILVITFTLGVFFPLVGISLVALLIFDFLILRRIPPLARAFGVV